MEQLLFFLKLCPRFRMWARFAKGLQERQKLAAERTSEVTDPHIIAVGTIFAIIDSGQTKGQTWIRFDFVSVNFVHVEWRIGHDVVGLAEPLMRIFVEGDHFLDIAFQTVNRQIHPGRIGRAQRHDVVT